MCLASSTQAPRGGRTFKSLNYSRRSYAADRQSVKQDYDSDLLQCKTPTGVSRTSMDGRFQDGWLHVIWKWNKSICAWEYGIRVGWMGYKSMMGEGGGVVGMGCGGGQGWWCALLIGGA